MIWERFIIQLDRRLKGWKRLSIVTLMALAAFGMIAFDCVILIVFALYFAERSAP